MRIPCAGLSCIETSSNALAVSPIATPRWAGRQRRLNNSSLMRAGFRAEAALPARLGVRPGGTSRRYRHVSVHTNLKIICGGRPPLDLLLRASPIRMHPCQRPSIIRIFDVFWRSPIHWVQRDFQETRSALLVAVSGAAVASSPILDDLAPREKSLLLGSRTLHGNRHR